MHTLAHEVWHLHGIGNEAQTECNALQTTARAAMLLGADARAAQATAVYALIRFYPYEPDEYHQPCVNGGPGDLRPADPALALAEPATSVGMFVIVPFAICVEILPNLRDELLRHLRS